MTDRPEPFASIDAGIVEALAAQGVDCYPFEGGGLPAALPLATCVAEDGTPSVTQQAWQSRQVTYAVRYYTSLIGDPALCWQDAYTGLAKIIAALGSDITLGGHVRMVELGRWSIQAVETRDGGKPELMVEMFVDVKPKAH